MPLYQYFCPTCTAITERLKRWPPPNSIRCQCGEKAKRIRVNETGGRYRYADQPKKEEGTND